MKRVKLLFVDFPLSGAVFVVLGDADALFEEQVADTVGLCPVLLRLCRKTLCEMLTEFFAVESDPF